jgi:hypothetical protein
VNRPVDTDALAGVLALVDTHGLPMASLRAAGRTVVVLVDLDAQVEDWDAALASGYGVQRRILPAKPGAAGHPSVRVETRGAVGHAHVSVVLDRLATDDEVEAARSRWRARLMAGVR